MRRALVLAVPLFVVLALAVWRGQAPAPRPESAPPNEFSSARAMNVLRNVIDKTPHPIGTTANARVRARVIEQFHSLGYETTTQSRFLCNRDAWCGEVHNVIARTPGAPANDTVLLTAHYDSVGAGPGVSDDGMGVAALLEIARAIRNERFRHPVAFLMTEGEEANLLGAEAFVADKELSRGVAVAINVENRGTRGPSYMFETSRGNLWLIRHLAKGLEHPQATSLFYTLYNLLPNDTDVTVFKREGIACVNYAAVDGVNWYHTALDDYAHASPRTLQHQGENLLGSLRVFANADPAARSSADATYFDVLESFLVWWPQAWTLWIALASLLLLVFAARKSPPRILAYGALGAVVTILIAAVCGEGIALLSALRSQGIDFVAHPAPSVAAMWLTGIASALFAAAFFRKESQDQAALYGVAFAWHILGCIAALTLGGAAFLFIVPAAAVTVCALARLSAVATSSIASTIAAILIFPLGLVLYAGFGGPLMVITAVFIGISSTLWAPLFASARHGLVAAALAIACTGAAIILPPYDGDHPRPISITYVDDPAAPSPQWHVETVTDRLRGVAPFAPADPKLRPWNRGAVDWTAPAPRLDVPRVEMEGSRSADGVMLRVRSPRDANRLVLCVRGATISRINGLALPARQTGVRGDKWHFAFVSGVREMTVELAGKGPVEVVASDTSFGLPLAGAPLAQARYASAAVPVHDGDVTITRARATF